MKTIQALLKWLGYLLTIGSLVFLTIAVRDNLSSMPQGFIERYGTAWFGVAVLLFLGSVTCGFLIWQVLLNQHGVVIPRVSSAHVYYLSQIGKYVPGNIAQHLSRVMLAGKRKVPPALTARLIILEVSIVLLSAIVFVCLIGILSNDLRRALLAISEGRRGMTGAVVAFLALLSMVVVAVSVRLWQRGGDRSLVLKDYQFKPVNLAPVVPLSFAAFFALGASFWILFTRCMGQSDPGFFTCVFWITTSWIISFVTPGAPAGLGVREFVLVLLITLNFGQPIALEAAIGFRIVSIVGDVAVFLIGLVAGLAKGEAVFEATSIEGA